MSTALMESAAPTVTPDQLDLVRRTVASGATADELKLYLYDCARQGVHPLDKLIHFTKRKGRYTPITSIDFMRTRAADTGEYAGSNDAVYAGEARTDAFAASVTVFRMVQGQRCPFTATARWSEYKPAENDFMWQKMPHTMLAKCAEALALRKGFPRQLAGLYAKEEMDQAGSNGGYTVEAPAATQAIPPESARGLSPSAPNGGDIGALHAESSAGAAIQGEKPTTAPSDDQPANPCMLVDLTVAPTRKANCKKYTLTFVDANGEQRYASTIREQLGALLHELLREAQPVNITVLKTKWGVDLESIQRVVAPPVVGSVQSVPITAEEIPF